MDTWELVISIGALLLATMFINTIAAEIEYREHQRQLKILKLKRAIDELEDYLLKLHSFAWPENVQELILNEIIVRYGEIQALDKKVHGIEKLIEDAKKQFGKKEKTDEENEEPKVFTEIESEREIQKHLSIIRSVTEYIKVLNIKSTLPAIKTSMVDELMGYKFAVINQFYTKQVHNCIENKEHKKGLDFVQKIQHAITLSSYKNEYIKDLFDQAQVLEEDLKERIAEDKKEEERLEEEKAKKLEEEQADKKKNREIDH